LAIMAAFPEQVLRMGLLEIAAADLGRWDLSRDRKHRHSAPMGVEQAVDQMQIAGTAGAGTDRELARDVGFARSRKRRHFLVPDMHPFDRAAASQGLCETVEAVADDPEDPLDPGLLQCRDEKVGYVVDGHAALPVCRRMLHRRSAGGTLTPEI